jgi:hypothetical protein
LKESREKNSSILIKGMDSPKASSLDDRRRVATKDGKMDEVNNEWELSQIPHQSASGKHPDTSTRTLVASGNQPVHGAAVRR